MEGRGSRRFYIARLVRGTRVHGFFLVLYTISFCIILCNIMM